MQGRHESLWIATHEGLAAPPLEQDTQCDVAVVGGGMVGLLSAYMLQQEGKDVVVLEAGSLLHGVTGHTTAKLTAQHGAIYQKLTKRFGLEAARTHAEANEQGRRWIGDAARRLQADAQLHAAPAYIYAETASEAKVLRQEAEAATKAGLPMEFTQETELPFAVEGALRLDDQAHFHPLRFLDAVAQAFIDGGGRIHQHSPVVDIEDGAPCTVRTQQATVTAHDVVVATNVPINDRAYFVTRMKPSRGYGISVRSDFPLEGMYINQGAPVRSVRPYASDQGPMLVIVGERHPVGGDVETQKHHEALFEFAREHFGADSIVHRWSTQDYYPVDDLPFIGRLSPRGKHVWTATGFRGWGMTQSVVAALILSDAVRGRQHPWADLYDPFSAVRALKEVPGAAKLQAEVGKKLVKGYMANAHDELAPGDGAVKKIGGHPVAVHRDGEGTIHARSAICTHMGCVVAWNKGEQSWDCPCHGSRFAGNDVLHGPATKPLAEVEEGAKE